MVGPCQPSTLSQSAYQRARHRFDNHLAGSFEAVACGENPPLKRGDEMKLYGAIDLRVPQVPPLDLGTTPHPLVKRLALLGRANAEISSPAD
jgi:hypothetical protein